MGLDLSYEQTFWNKNTDLVIGIDEVGRGPLAGPVVVGAVVFNKNHSPIAEINDSKKIPIRLRSGLAQKIKSTSLSWAISVGSVEMINERGIIYALQYAISEAIQKVTIQLPAVNATYHKPYTTHQSTTYTSTTLSTSIPHTNIQIIIDGLAYKDATQFSRQCQNLHENQRVEYRPKADGTIYSVAAASILAKVYRDELMAELAKQHNHYGWEQNAGYGTKQHREAIQQFGITEHHRELFCRNLL